MRKFPIGIYLVLVLGMQVANAAEWSPPTDAEWERLPSFCMVKKRELNKTDPMALHTGISLIGPQFQNAHHFCFGLNFLNRYYRAPLSAGAGSNLSMAKNELDYMVDHMTPGSSIAGEIFLHRGIVNSLSKKDAGALLDFQQAISHNPLLAKAYLALADYYSERKQREKALDVVTEGLRHVPDNKGLKRRYQELGGKLPYPEPIVAQPQPEAEPEKTARKPAEADGGTGAQAETTAGPSREPAIDKTVDKKEASTEGASKKPWCRFCPDEP